MLVRLESSVSLGRVFDKEFSNEVFGLVTAFVEGLAVESVDALFDAHEDGSDILPIEGRAPTQQDIQNNSACPIVHFFPVFAINHLRSKIHGGALGLVLELLLLEDLRNSKVNQLDALNVVLLFKQDILGFQVTMADVVVVEVGDGWKYLAHYDGSLSLCDELLFDNQVEELTALAHLSHQVDGLLGLVHLVELDDVGMIQFLQQLYLGCKHLLVHDVLLGNGLDCSALACVWG